MIKRIIDPLLIVARWDGKLFGTLASEGQWPVALW
jgi:hypothetical protein